MKAPRGSRLLNLRQMAYQYERLSFRTDDNSEAGQCLRVIFDNGTENNMLMHSLKRALQKDDSGRRITEATAGPLVTNKTIDGDEASGTIYVLLSESQLSVVRVFGTD